ncbi:MAG: YraN family protein [Candidatus Limnocylindria bacterium]
MGTFPRFRASRLELGRAGEKAAADLLRSRGYELVGAGFRARRGELDLVCRRGGQLVVVEVKTRTDGAFGTPLEAVGPRKRRAMMSAAAEYRALAGWRGPIRFAVVGLTVEPAGGFQAELVEDPFD